MKDTAVYLHHILECIQAIQDYYDGTSNPRATFFEDDKTQQATLHRLQTLGQAVKSIPDDVRQRISSEIDWFAIADFRNVLVHEYLGIDLEVVWGVIEQDLPVLQKTIEDYLGEPS